MGQNELSKSLDEVRSKLYNIRKKRIRPLLDDKILTDWNGLLMAALATAGAVFDDADFTNAAQNVESFISSKMVTSDGRLLHRFRDDEAGIDAMADDFAALVWGLIELYETTFDPVYLKKAISYQDQFASQFSDETHGGYYFTSSESETPMGRQKEIYDGALPSSNSIAALNGFRLSRLTGDPEYERESERILSAFSEVISDNPSAYTFALLTKMTQQNGPREIAVTVREESSELAGILEYLSAINRFQNSIILKTVKTEQALSELSPFTNSFPLGGSPKIYICRNFSCDAPVYSLEELKENLK